jgi:DNA-binding XRE family transcriptional regulator
MRIRPRENAVYQAYTGLGVSRDEMARRMGVSTATAYRVEQGKTDPSPQFIAALMTVTGKPFEDLFEIVAVAA